MKNKTKWVLWGFFSLDYKAMETYLESMAEKGWMPEKIGRYLAKFRAIEPQKLKFYVDVFKKGGALVPENNEESIEYRMLCQESGWTFITSQEYLQFFYADGDSEPTPIQTDEEIEQKIVESTLLRSELLGMFLFLAIAVFILFKNIPLRYTSLLSFTGVVLTYLFPILCTVTIIPAVYSIIWTINARRNIKNGISIEKPTLKSARRRILVFNGLTWCYILIFLLAFIADAFLKPYDVLVALIGPIIGIAAGTGFRYLIKKSKIKEDYRVLLAVVGIIIVIFFIPTTISFLMDKSDDFYKIDSAPEGYPIIVIEEIIEDSKQGSILNMEFIPGKSPVTPIHYTYSETKSVNGVSKSLKIKYYKTTKEKFSQIIFDGIIDKLEKGMKWKGMTLFTKDVITNYEMKNIWDVDDLAVTEELDEIIIRKGNIVLHLTDFTGDIDFEDNKTKELIVSRFFSD